MIAARIATTTAFLALILPVAALVFAQNTWAASGNVQECQPNTSCTVGEFLYNDSYTPITTATCTITSRYPNGTLFLNNVNMPVSAGGDGWYAHTFTAPTTLGLYRTEVKCTTGSETLALDKSFEVQSTTSTLTSTDVTSAVWNANRSSFTASGSFGQALQNIVPGSSDVASSVWGYSGRTLTGFGTLIADIWANATRTLSDNSSSDISTAKSDISSVKTDISDVKKKVNDLTTTTTTTNITSITNNMLEQLINKPIMGHVVEESSFTTTELQTKLDKSDEMASQLLTSATYIKSKANLIKGRGGDITKTVGQLETVLNSMDGQINWIAEQWDFPISYKLIALNKKLALSLKNVKSISQLKVLSSDLDNFIKLIGSEGDSPKSNTLFGALQGKKELSSTLDKNYIAASALLPNFGKDSKPSTDQIAQINVLGAQIAAINQLPKMNKTILSLANAKMDQKQLKNKTLSLRGIIGANKQFLAQKPNEPLRSLWFEEGSIVFKTLISNPSKLISQKVPLKYYLPKEVTRENIIKTDEELTINYDTEKDQYYISGNFTLDPGETKTLSVTVDDSVFHINDQEIATMRKQAEELSKPLANTAYFAQGVTLKTDIDASLDKVESLQKNNTTPEVKIRSYRESIIEFKAAKEKLEKLKELATTAGSVGTLFGFVGGAQALAVWGLIIIMAAGFVFLALYMRTLKANELYLAQRNQKLPPIVDSFENYEEIPNEEKPQPSTPSQKRIHFGKPFRYMAVVAISVLIGGSSIYALAILRQGQIKHQVTQTPPQVKPEIAQAVLGSSDTNTPDSYKEVNILVPDESMVTIHAEPTINSPVLTSLNASQKAREITRQDIWVKVSLQDADGKEIVGWVDGDFLETEAEIEKPQSPITPTTTITVKDTPTGFLRVRKTPGGQELTKISPGEQYNMIKEQTGWVQIVLEDGTSGWVSKQYVSF